MSKIWDAMKQAERERGERLYVVSDDAGFRPLSARQRAAIDALIDAGSLEEAGQACGVNVRTLRRWLGLAHFVSAYHQAAATCYVESMAQLRAASGEAVETLRRALRSETESVRLQAAAALLDLANKSAMADAVGSLERRKRGKGD
jgi:hypothetical protein